ncbi:hypothetical protein V1521DRAFT_161536 [Lipomyces starkeyi]
MAYHLHQTLREEEDDVVVVVLTFTLLASLKVSRNRCYLTRPVLVSPNNSPWQILRASGDEKAFIITTGLNPAIFNYVLDCGFRHAWDASTITRHDVSDNGKPRPYRRSIDADAVLGLALHYLNSCMAQFTLQEIFGIVASVCTRYIRRGLQILLEILRVRVPEAKKKWPKSSELQLYSELIRAQHPMLRKGFGFMDGLHLPVEVFRRY